MSRRAGSDSLLTVIETLFVHHHHGRHCDGTPVVDESLRREPEGPRSQSSEPVAI
ncbi:MAG: hypothetical protein ACR2JF_05250 [Iamia sp.]